MDQAITPAAQAGTRPLLLSPMTLRGLTARNRIVVSPMSQYAAVDGAPTDWHLVHLGKFAMGGAGIVFVEETSVEERARKTYACPGIYTDAQARAWRRITDFLRSQGALCGIQLGHAGRKVATKAPWEGFAPLTGEDARDGRPPWRGLAPSPIPFKPGAQVPIEMDRDDISHVIASHVEACRRSLDAGFDICEIHGAHGYIIQQFLSPITNRRTDAYGGDRAGRMRFCLEVVEAVREAWPKDRPLFFRAACVDGKGGAWELEDTIALARELKARGVDVIDCSSGGIEGPLTLALVPRVPGYHVPFAERIRREAEIPTMAVGLITGAAQAESYLAEGRCDLVALAREMMWNPNWPAHAAQALGAPDPLDLLPRSYAWWLRRREEVRRLTGDEAKGPSVESVMDEARRFGASPDQARLVHSLVKRHPFPEAVKAFEMKFGQDSTDDPALWITFLVDEDLKPSPENIRELNRFTDEVLSDLLREHLPFWPYVQLRAVS